MVDMIISQCLFRYLSFIMMMGPYHGQYRGQFIRFGGMEGASG